VPQLFTFDARDASTIRDSILRVLRNGLIAIGVENPNVTPGSDWYVLAQSVANELTVVEANAAIKADAQMPDSADGEDLARIAAIYGLSLQPAAGSAGTVALTTSALTSVVTGAELIDGAGLRYRVTVGGLFDDGDLISIEAVDTGSGTNHAEDDVLRWQSAPPFADEKALVGVGGLVNGHDEEGYEGLRARLLAKLSTPPRSGNWEHVAELAEASAPAVQKAFVYPAVQGAGTVHIAVTAAPTDEVKTRDVNDATMTGTVIPYVQGQLPEHVYSVITTVTNVPCDVTFMIALPDAPTASPSGPGGGWLDGTPWPDVGASGEGCRVTTVTSSQILIVDALIPPFAGVSRVSWLSTDDWLVRTARVVTKTGSSGAYTITIDAPFTGIAVGDFLWPACQNAQTYADAVLDAFALMGPGEKTDNASVLIRGFRHPRPRTAWQSSLSPQMLRDVTDAGDEVDTALYLWRSDGTNELSVTTGSLTPEAPASLSDPPNQFTPNRLGFYPLV
jgi:uncharacterized phage protein gp47/JayE